MNSGASRIWGRRWLGCIALLASVVACHEDVTSELAFACATASDCASGWVCAPQSAGLRCVRAAVVPSDVGAETFDASEVVDATVNDTLAVVETIDTLDAIDGIEVGDTTDTTDTVETTPTLCDHLRAGNLTLAAPTTVNTSQIPVTTSDFVLDARLASEHAVTVIELVDDGTSALVRHIPNRSQIIASGLEGVFFGLAELPDGGWILARNAPAGLVRVGPTGTVDATWFDHGLVAPVSLALLSTPEGPGLLVGDGGAELAWYLPPAWLSDGVGDGRPLIVATDLYMASHVATARDGAFAAYASAPAAWVARQTFSPPYQFSSPAFTAGFANATLPPTVATCDYAFEPCWNASGAPGRCELRDGLPICIAQRASREPRVAICEGGADGPCALNYAGVTFDGECTLSGEHPTRVVYCALDAPAHDATLACAARAAGDPCAFLLPAFGRDAFPTGDDRDADGLSDAAELLWGSDPDDFDSDDDTWADGVEPLWYIDVDGDGLIAARDPDSDGDGLPDSSDYVEPTPNQGTCVPAGEVGRPDVPPTTLVCANGYQHAMLHGLVGGLAVHECGALFYTEFQPFQPEAGSLWGLAPTPSDEPRLIGSGLSFQRLHFGDAAAWGADTLYTIDRGAGQVIGLRLIPQPSFE